MAFIADRADVGFFPLQDHSAKAEKVSVSNRLSIAGCRIGNLKDPGSGGSGKSWIEYAKEDGKGTLGDIHPWSFWQTKDRDLRGMGAWSMVWGCLIEKAGDRYGGFEAIPFRTSAFTGDSRFKAKTPAWHGSLPDRVKGQMAIIIPGTDEGAQHDLVYHADPRLVAPHVSGPYTAGTLVTDLQPTGALCMDGATIPGRKGRHARLQSLVRVIATGGNKVGALALEDNFLALNYSLSNLDGLPGWGAIWTGLAQKGSAGGGKTGSGDPSKPTTPGSGSQAFSGNEGVDAPEQGQGTTPNGVGVFAPQLTKSHGVALMASVMYGPIHGGSEDDQHFIAQDRDGHPIQSAHLWTNAYFTSGGKEDGPINFEPTYPDPPDYPLVVKAHIGWNPAEPHPKFGGQGQGKWMLWADNPYEGGSGPPTPSRPMPPVVPKTPGTGGPGQPGPQPPTPSTPGIPTIPKTPGSGGPGAQPGTPTTFGRFDPTGRLGKQYQERLKKIEKAQAAQRQGETDTPPMTPPSLPLDGEDLKEQRAEAPENDFVKRVGALTPSQIGLYSIFHPMQEGFASIGFRPELMVKGARAFEHNPRAPREEILREIDHRPQVLTARAWGAQAGSGARGWNYLATPGQSRVKGGIAAGGVLFSPPEFELEDYLGLGTGEVKGNTGTTAFVMAAPGVGFALGTPETDGGLANGSIIFDQQDSTSDSLEPFQISQVVSGTVVKLMEGKVDSGGDRVVKFNGHDGVRIPVGTTAQRPSSLVEDGILRINTSGASDVLEFYSDPSWIQVTPASGYSGSWENAEGNTVTVVDGLITDVS